MTKCQHCDADILSTSQPNRMGTTPEMQKMYDEFGGKPVVYRWRQPGNKHWIYDPTPEWIEDHKHEIELEPLYAALAATPAETLERIAELQYEAGMYKCLYENAQKCLAATPAKKWDAGEHEGCGIDSQRAFADTPAVGGEIMREKLAVLQNAGVKSLTINQVGGLLGFAETEAALAQPASPLRGRTSPMTRHLRMIARDIDDSHWAESINAAADILEKPTSPPEQPAAAPVTEYVTIYGDIKWLRVNDEPFEYAIQQGPHGNEFVKLIGGKCLRRSLSPTATETQS